MRVPASGRDTALTAQQAQLQHRHTHFTPFRATCTPCKGNSSTLRAAASSSTWQDSSSGSSYTRQAIKTELLQRIDSLGTQSILPGRAEDKAQVDALVARLKQLPPSRKWGARVGPNARSLDDSNQVVTSISPEQADQQLYGTWRLIYASNGTAVTRTGFAQALITASTQLPGVGIQRIQQILRKEAQGAIATSNEAEFGFGLLGSWQVGIEGQWKVPSNAIAGDVSCVKVVFERLKVRPVGVLSLKLPDWLPQLLLSLGGDDKSTARTGADWYTTYLDEDIRVGEGRSGNLFVFRKVVTDSDS